MNFYTRKQSQEFYEGIIMKKLSSIFAVLCLSLFGTSVFAGGSDCWGNGGADVSTDKIKQEKLDKEA